MFCLDHDLIRHILRYALAGALLVLAWHAVEAGRAPVDPDDRMRH